MLMTPVLGKLLVGCVVILEMLWFCADSCCWWCVCKTAKYLKLLRITFVTAVTGVSKYTSVFGGEGGGGCSWWFVADVFSAW